jgi:hypothetical protein
LVVKAPGLLKLMTEKNQRNRYVLFEESVTLNPAPGIVVDSVAALCAGVHG